MTKEINVKNKFQTSDFLTVIVLSLDNNIEWIEWVSPNKAVFTFRKTQKLHERLLDYQRGELLVEPQAFYTQLRHIKSRLELSKLEMQERELHGTK